MLTDTERAELIAKVRALPESAEAAIAGLTDEQLDTPYRDGGWTPRQVIHHLADSHSNAMTRVKLILTEDHPTLRPYDQNKWAELPDNAACPLAASLEMLRGLHQRFAILLENIPADAWGRVGFHPENGEMSLDDLLRVYGNHGERHVDQIKSLRASHGW